MALRMDPQQRELWLLSEFARFDGARVVELGCGDGRLTHAYAGRTALVVGVEPQPLLLARALRSRPPEASHVAFTQADAGHLPFRDGSFDIALLAWSL